MERHVLETRRKMLDQYLKTLMDPVTLESNLGLIILMHRFLDQVFWFFEKFYTVTYLNQNCVIKSSSKSGCTTSHEMCLFQMKHISTFSWFSIYIIFQSSYENERTSQPLNVLKAVGSVRNSVKNVTNVVTSVPNNLIHTVDSVMDGITKALQV